MDLAPGVYPVFSRIDVLQNLLSGNIVIPEVCLMGLCLKAFELRLLLVEFKDTPSAKRVASSVEPVFLLGLQTCLQCNVVIDVYFHPQQRSTEGLSLRIIL
jgi:hypothetical protein